MITPATRGATLGLPAWTGWAGGRARLPRPSLGKGRRPHRGRGTSKGPHGGSPFQADRSEAEAGAGQVPQAPCPLPPQALPMRTPRRAANQVPAPRERSSRPRRGAGRDQKACGGHRTWGPGQVPRWAQRLLAAHRVHPSPLTTQAQAPAQAVGDGSHQSPGLITGASFGILAGLPGQ